MRVLVQARALDPGSRLALAAIGLAQRGHEVAWAASPAARDEVARLTDGHVPPGLRVVAPGLGWMREQADVALGPGRDPVGAALAGLLARAPAMVLDLRAEDVARWGPAGRLAWEGVHAMALVAEEDAAGFHDGKHGLELERLALWSDAPVPERADPAHPDVEVLERACERGRARHRARALRPAVFVDRDGTLVIERGYLSDPDGLELLPGAAGALRRLRAAGFALVVVSNQSGVGRGLFSLTRAHEAMARLRARLREQGAEPDAIWFCPHHPDAGCRCRKPGVALLERASEDLLLDLRHSFTVGDKLLDARTGQAAGGRGVLVRSGYGREEERRLEPGSRGPDHVSEDLAEAAGWILAESDPAG